MSDIIKINNLKHDLIVIGNQRITYLDVLLDGAIVDIIYQIGIQLELIKLIEIGILIIINNINYFIFPLGHPLADR